MKNIPDVVIIFKKDIQEILFGDCEVKVHDVPERKLQDALNQQYVQSITRQRSVLQSQSGHWLLPGLVLYEHSAYITMLETGSWWEYPVKLLYVHEYKFDFKEGDVNPFTEESARQLLGVLDLYVKTLINVSVNDPHVKGVSSDYLFDPTKVVPYFPYPDSTITRLKAQHIALCKFEMVKQYIIGERIERTGVVWSCDTSSLLPEDDVNVVVKVFCYAIYSHAKGQRLSEFLKSLSGLLDKLKLAEKDLKLAEKDLKLAEKDLKLAEKDLEIAKLRAKLSKKSSPKKLKHSETSPPSASSSSDHQPVNDREWIEKTFNHHVWYGCSLHNENLNLIVTRYAGNRVTSDSAVFNKWSEKKTRDAFFKDVCVPALRVVKNGYFHGDIRPANIVARIEGNAVHFTLIDWDGVRLVNEVRERAVEKDSRYPSVANAGSSDNERAALFSCSQLFVCIAIISLVANKGMNAVNLEFEWCKKKDFWTEYHEEYQLHKWGGRGIRSLIEAFKGSSAHKDDSWFIEILQCALKAENDKDDK
jgi:hypothetical protein